MHTEHRNSHPLAELAEITVGHVGPMASEYVSNGIPFLRSQDVKPFRLDLSAVKYISEAFHERLKKSALHPGDVVVVRTGAPGVAAVVPDDLTVANCADLVVIRPGPNLVPRYLAYFINGAAKGYVYSRIVGAVQQHFNVGAARELEIPGISIAEQAAIAEVLGALDFKIEANQTIAMRAEDLATTAVLLASEMVPIGAVATVARNPVSISFFANRDVEHFSIPAFDAGQLPVVESGDGIKSGKFLLDEPAVLVSKLNPQTPRVWMAVPSGEAPAVTSTEFVALRPAGGYRSRSFGHCVPLRHSRLSWSRW